MSPVPRPQRWLRSLGQSLSLSAYAGTTVALKFTGTEDSSLQTSFVIDDTAVTTN